MKRFVLGVFALGGCFTNPTVSVDQASLDVPRGTATDIVVSIDGAPVWNLDEVLWSVDDEELVTVTASDDGSHLRVGGNYEGETVVHVSSHGQDVAIPTRVGPPAIVQLWTEPGNVSTHVGSEVRLRALALDTLARVSDITFESRWDVRDDALANLDQAGMMLHAMDIGTTTLHVSYGSTFTVVPVAIFK